jgi:hypothetical protein
MDFKTAVNNLDLKLIATKYGENYVERLKYYITRTNKIASGKLLNSINYKIIKNATIYFVKIMAEPYIQEVNDGVITKDVSLKSIKKWIKVKNIHFNKLDDNTTAFLITRKLNSTKKFNTSYNNPSHIIDQAKRDTLILMKQEKYNLSDIDKKKLLEEITNEIVNIPTSGNFKITKK